MGTGWLSKASVLAVLVSGLVGLFGCSAANSMGASQTTAPLSVSNASLVFGTVVAGATSSVTDTLTNNSTAAVTVTSASISDPNFQFASLALPFTLNSGQSTKVSINFAPHSAGSPSGSVKLFSAGGMVQFAVSGSAVNAGSLAVNPSNLSFGNVQVGKTNTQNVTLTNPGGSSVTVSQTSASSGAFQLTGLQLPATLSPGQSVNATVAFAPKATGEVSGNVSLSGSASLSVSQTGTQSTTSTATSITVSGDGVTPGQVALTPGAFNFQNVQVGKTQTLTGALSNSGGTSATISAAAVSGAGFSISGLSTPLTLAAGQTVNFSLTFAPQSAGTASGTFSVTSSASGTPVSATLSGTGVSSAGSLSASATSLSFGSVQVGANKSLSETLTNNGAATVTVSQATESGAGFSVSGLATPVQLSSGQSITFSVLFAPSSAGSASGNLTISSNASNSSLSIPLAGTGTAAGQLSVNPTGLSFGNVTVGANKALTATLTASGASVTISSASSNSSEFTVSGLSLPTTLAAGQSATFSVTFVPQTAGSASASISFSSNASPSATTLTASGAGVAAPSHSVTLSWNAEGSSIVGYNVYRAQQSAGPYSLLNGSLLSTTSYTDSTVLGGQTYYYAVTAVDTQGIESAQSSSVPAVIPSP